MITVFYRATDNCFLRYSTKKIKQFLRKLRNPNFLISAATFTIYSIVNHREQCTLICRLKRHPLENDHVSAGSSKRDDSVVLCYMSWLA